MLNVNNEKLLRNDITSLRTAKFSQVIFNQ